MSSPFYSPSSCYGQSEQHLVRLDENIKLHTDAVIAWTTLQGAAKEAGFELTIASGYRSFERQCLIWNAKLKGERPVLDEEACVIDLSCLPAEERVRRVLRWSALPGASRHHWGSDIDIYDRAAVADTYALQLVPEEYCSRGPFAPMMLWLHDYLNENPSLGFYFPYQQDEGGVMPEPWHMSYRPVAKQFQSLWNLSGLASCIGASDIEEKTTILNHLDSLYHDFVRSSINPKVPV